MERIPSCFNNDKLRLYSYLIDGTTDSFGSILGGSVDIKGYPLCFIPDPNENCNYPCNVLVDISRNIYVKPINKDWKTTYAGLPNTAIKGTLYCAK